MKLELGESLFGVLPYIDGCSSRNLVYPDRPGAPSLQLMEMAPWTSEQAHHVHSTARVVYIAKGNGTCVIGRENENKSFDLREGQVLLLEKFCPHHFETQEQGLIVLPLHVFSTLPGENQHPMRWGTHEI